MRIFLDTETTGFQPGQIAQLSYIITDDKLQPIAASNYYFQVDNMDYGASAVNGLTVQSLRQLSQGLRFADHLTQISAEIAEHPIICHNVGFDRKFLVTEYLRLGKRYEPRSHFCTMMTLAPIFGKRPKLLDAVRHFAITEHEIMQETRRLFHCDDAGAHDSRYDVTATLLVSRQAHAFIHPWIKDTAVSSAALPTASSEAAATVPPKVQRPHTERSN